MDTQRERLLTALPALLRELAASGVTELEVSYGDRRSTSGSAPGPPRRLERRRSAGGERSASPRRAWRTSPPPWPASSTAPPSPDEPPFVSEGEAVEAGQVVALVEAMKVFNEIHADVSGVVVAILASNGQTVLAGQTLITIRPDEAGGQLTAEPLSRPEPARRPERRQSARPSSRRACQAGQRKTLAPQVRPPPKPASRMWAPGRTRPSSTASQRAMGMEAADVLP